MSDTIQVLINRQKKYFSILIGIAAILFIIDIIIHGKIGSINPPVISIKAWGYLSFLTAIVTGVGVPILLRISFQRNAAKTRKPTLEGYERLQKNLLWSVFISCIFADIGYIFPVHTVYLYGAFFSCLYGIYSVIPYRKKLIAELKFYRLTEK